MPRRPGGRKFSSGKNAYGICDRSGLRYPISELMREPGTGLLVHRSESDGRWNRVDHPLNKAPFSGGDAIGLRDARPDRREDDQSVWALLSANTSVDHTMSRLVIPRVSQDDSLRLLSPDPVFNRFIVGFGLKAATGSYSITITRTDGTTFVTAQTASAVETVVSVGVPLSANSTLSGTIVGVSGAVYPEIMTLFRKGLS